MSQNAGWRGDSKAGIGRRELLIGTAVAGGSAAMGGLLARRAEAQPAADISGELVACVAGGAWETAFREHMAKPFGQKYPRSSCTSTCRRARFSWPSCGPRAGATRPSMWSRCWTSRWTSPCARGSSIPSMRARCRTSSRSTPSRRRPSGRRTASTSARIRTGGSSVSAERYTPL